MSFIVFGTIFLSLSGYIIPNDVLMQGFNGGSDKSDPYEDLSINNA